MRARNKKLPNRYKDDQQLLTIGKDQLPAQRFLAALIIQRFWNRRKHLNILRSKVYTLV